MELSAQPCGSRTISPAPHSAPQAAKEISHTTVAALLAAGEISPKENGIQPKSLCQHLLWVQKKESLVLLDPARCPTVASHAPP